MDKYIYDKSNGLWYERCGDYYLPCLALPEQKSVGKWGQKYRAYLRKHKREVYNVFQSDGTLDEHVAEIDQQAEEMFERLVKQIAIRQGITERLKAVDQMAWVSAMNHVFTTSNSDEYRFLYKISIMEVINYEQHFGRH